MSGPVQGSMLRGFYWAIRRDWRNIPHVLRVIANAAATVLRLRWNGIGRPMLAIGLIEHLGDVMAAEPVSRAARKAHPTAWIVWMVRPSYAPLVQNFAAVDQVLTVSCLSEWMLLARSGLFTTVWDFHLAGRYCPHCLIPRADGVLGRDNYYLKSNSLLDSACHNAGIATPNDAPRLPVNRGAVARIAMCDLPERYVVLHAASGDAAREWQDAHWQTLREALRERGDVALVEIGLHPRVITAPAPGQYDLCGQLSILETAEVIRGALVFIGIDSGPAHLANAVDTPGVIVMGKYLSFERYMPFTGPYAGDSGADLLWADGPAASMQPDRVIAAVTHRLERLRDGNDDPLPVMRHQD